MARQGHDTASTALLEPTTQDPRSGERQRHELQAFNVPSEAVGPLERLDLDAWQNRVPVQGRRFDFDAVAHWSADGVFFPPGLDPLTLEFIHHAYADAYQQGYLWCALTQSWVSMPEPTPELPDAFEEPEVVEWVSVADLIGTEDFEVFFAEQVPTTTLQAI